MGPVEAADVVHGYEYGPGQHLLVEPEELDKLRPAQAGGPVKLDLARHCVEGHSIPVTFSRQRAFTSNESGCGRRRQGQRESIA
jgi:hypothetical protein